MDAANAARQPLTTPEFKNAVCPLATKMKTVAGDLQDGIDDGCVKPAQEKGNAVENAIKALEQYSDVEAARTCQ